MLGSVPGDGTFQGVVTAAPILKRLCSSSVLNSWVLVWKYSSPESGFGASMFVAIVYGTVFRSAPCSAHYGIGLLRSLPTTPSKVFPSPGPYRRPNMLSRDRFSNSTSTTWSIARERSRLIGVAFGVRVGERHQRVAVTRSAPPATARPLRPILRPRLSLVREI